MKYEITCPACKGAGGYYGEHYKTGKPLWAMCSTCYASGRIEGIKMGIEIKGLSLTQPWATLMAIKAKRIETRSWQVTWRGWVAIHASGKFTDADMRVASSVPFRIDLSKAGYRNVGSLPVGAFVALLELTAIESTARIDLASISEREMYYGNYGPGRFAWYTDNVIALAEPIPFKATQRLFTVPDPIADRILRSAGIDVDPRRGALILSCPHCGMVIEAITKEVADFVRKYGCGACRDKEAEAEDAAEARQTRYERRFEEVEA